MAETIASSEVRARLVQTESEAVVEIDFSPDLVQKAYARVAREVSNRLDIPGFRRGYAPVSLVARRVGQAQFQEWVAHELVNRHWEEIIEQAQIQPPASRDQGKPAIQVQVDHIEVGQPGRVSLRGQIVHVQIPNIQDFKESYQVPAITDEHIDAALEQVVRQQSTVTLSSRSHVEWGDWVSIEVQVASQGRVLSGQTKPERRMIEVGRHQYSPDLDPLVHGAQRNVPKIAVVTFPADHPNEELRGRAAEVQLKVLDIFEIHRPQIDEEFLRTHFGLASMSEVRQFLGDRLARAAEQRALEEVQARLVDRLVEASHISLPPHEVEQAVQDELVHIRQQMQEARQAFDGSQEELEEAVRSAVRRRLARDYLLDHIAEREKLRPSEAELEMAAGHLAAHTGYTPEQIAEQIEADPEFMRSLYRLAQRRLAADFILQEAQVYRETPSGSEPFQDPTETVVVLAAPEEGVKPD